VISSVEMIPRPAGGRYAGISFGNSMPCLRAQRVKRACVPVVAGVGAVLRSVICFLLVAECQYLYLGCKEVVVVVEGMFILPWLISGGGRIEASESGE